MTIKQQLSKLKHGTVEIINDVEIKRDYDAFIVGGDSLTLDEVLQRFGKSEQPKSGIDYSETAFLEKSKSGTLIKIHKVNNRAAHSKLVVSVRSKNHYLWYATVKKINNKFYAIPPHLVDWDSVPESITKSKDKPVGLACPFCKKKLRSTSGKTLHVKRHHPEKVE